MCLVQADSDGMLVVCRENARWRVNTHCRLGLDCHNGGSGSIGLAEDGRARSCVVVFKIE